MSIVPTTRLEISISALQHNIICIRSILAPHSQLFSVVKANCYGHGLEAARYLEEHVDGFCIVTISEGVQLRNLGITKRLVVVGLIENPEDWQRAQQYHLEAAVINSHFLPLLSKELPPLQVHIKINTGLNRLGIMPHQFGQLFQELDHPLVQIRGVYSHLADAENPESQQTKEQLQIFQNTLDSFSDYTKNLDKHIAASAATLLFPQAHYSFVRVGISTYGIWPSLETKEAWQAVTATPFELRPALQWKTTIASIQDVPSGSLIGYGGTYRTRRPSRIATVPIGYYEGVPRYLSNKGYMSLHGQQVPIVGNVCMNMTMIDITAIPSAHLGDEVTFISNDAEASNSAEKLSASVNTIPYTLLSTIQAHIPRVFVN